MQQTLSEGSQVDYFVDYSFLTQISEFEIHILW